MKPLTITLGTSALVLALADLIHGQHNGDIHRYYIHIAEFAAFLGFLSVLEVQAFSLIEEKFALGRWFASVFLSLTSCLVGFAVFGLAGGGVHGDGGPIAVSFALIGLIGTIGMPISLLGFIVAFFMRKRQRSSRFVR